MQGLLPKYLEHAMTTFSQQQEQMRTAMQKTMGTLFPFGNMEEVTRQNRAMMERAFSMFSPFIGAAKPVPPAPSREHRTGGRCPTRRSGAAAPRVGGRQGIQGLTTAAEA